MILSFDSPAQDTWFKKAVDASMYMWGDMRAMIRDESALDVGGSLYVALDAMVGRLAYADFCLERLDQDNRELYGQDVLYLARILEKIASECELLRDKVITADHHHNTDHADSDRIACMQHMLARVRSTLALKSDIYLRTSGDTAVRPSGLL
jgi:hypothetical protein